MIRLAPILLSCLALSACSSGDTGSLPGDREDTQPFAGISEESVLLVVGTEPFWSLNIDGEEMTYKSPENLEGTTVPVTRFAGRGGLSFNGELDGVSIDIAITPGECSDGMSDHTYPFTATVQLGDEQLNGCAWREGEDDIGPGETSTADIA